MTASSLFGAAASSSVEPTFALAAALDDPPYIAVYAFESSGFKTLYSNPGISLPGRARSVKFSPSGDAIAVAHQGTPYITAYPWNKSTGFGTKYANPTTPPTGISNSVVFSPTNDAIAVAHNTTPYISVYPWNNSTGFGTRYSDPTTLPAGTGQDVTFNPSGNAIAIGHTGSPYLSVYPWNSSTGFGTKYANPTTLPNSDARSVTFSPSGSVIFAGHGSSSPPNFISAYPWNSSTGFGTKYANVTTQPGGTVYSLTMNPNEDALVCGLYDASPYIAAYAWSPSGFGTKYTTSVTLGYAIANYARVAFSQNGKYVAVGNLAETYLTAYSWNSSTSTGFGSAFSSPTIPCQFPVTSVDWSIYGESASSENLIAGCGTGTPYVRVWKWQGWIGGSVFSNPATLPTGAGNGVAFSPNVDAIAVAHSTTPFITVYPWNSSTGFGTKYANPATLPAGTGQDVAFNPSGDTIAVSHSTSPYISVYPWNSSTGFGTKYANPTSLPSGTVTWVQWAPDGKSLVADSGSTTVMTYSWSSSGFGVRHYWSAAFGFDEMSFATVNI